MIQLMIAYASAHLLLAYSSLEPTVLQTNGQDTELPVSLCFLTTQPDAFVGKVVAVRGEIMSGFEVFGLRGFCDRGDGQLWLDVPGKALRPKLEDIAQWAQVPDMLTYARSRTHADLDWKPYPWPSSPLSVRDDKEWRRFWKYVNSQYKPKRKGETCISCPLYRVTATVVGRFDYIAQPMAVRPRSGLEEYVRGFGHLSGWRARIVMIGAREIVAERIKYEEFNR